MYPGIDDLFHCFGLLRSLLRTHSSHLKSADADRAPSGARYIIQEMISNSYDAYRRSILCFVVGSSVDSLAQMVGCGQDCNEVSVVKI